MEDVIYQPIGIVENKFQTSGNPKEMRNSSSLLVFEEKYITALKGLELFKYLIVIYHLNRSPGFTDQVHPMGELSIPKRGVLATRSPCRPNPLGLTVVEILEVMGNKILVTGLDALQGTPILDIKPYDEHFDSPLGIKWERDPNYSPSDRRRF